MAVDKNTIKNWFKKGLKPLQAQFEAWLDSYWHKDENIPIEKVDGLSGLFNETATQEQFELLSTNKENKLEKGEPNGYASLDENGKVHSSQLPVIGGSQNISSVLDVGNDADEKQIKNLANPTDPQDADTKSARESAIISAMATFKNLNQIGGMGL